MMEACCSRFTAAEGGARLAAAAATKNILAVEYASFIPVRLLYEKAYQIRGTLFEGSKRSVYISRASRVEVVAFELKILTDLGTVAAKNYADVYDWVAELDKKEVLICTSSVLKQILEERLLTMANINVLIVDSCHLIYSDENLKYIMKSYKNCPVDDQPIILALTYPLFTAHKKETETKPQDADEKMGVYENVDDFVMYEKLEWKIGELEEELSCQMDLAEDIDGGKRISSSVTKPRELIIEYGARPSDDQLPEEYVQLERFMRDTVLDALEFLDDHRHDPTEIYGEELYEEFKSLPDPAKDPKAIFNQFLYVLDQLGPYAAEKAAFVLLTKLEKLKIKVPYERHFILFCLCTTVFVKIRCYADLLYSKYQDEWERITTFSSPKVLRFAEILEKFRPPDIKNQNTPTIMNDTNLIGNNTQDVKEICSKNDSDTGCDTKTKSDTTKKMLNDIDECDFATLGNKIQDSVNTYELNLKDLDSPTVEETSIVGTSNIAENNKSIACTSKITENNKIIAGTSNIVANNNNIAGTSNIAENNKSITDTSNIVANHNSIADTSNIVANNNSIAGTSTTNTPSTSVIKSDTSNETDYANSVISNETQPDTRVGNDIKGNEVAQQRGLLGFTRRSGYRQRGKTRLQRNNAARVLQMQQNPDALCGVVFMKEPLIANIMFLILVDMTRCNHRLSFLCCQYCATDVPADPVTEPKEWQRQGKKQEEVLKKFRMHECNLLLATSELEEGIDLPRCNLVLRWDIPPSYRSYGLCRGRARAARATASLMCSNNPETTEMLLHNVAIYRELDQIISRKCGCGIQDEPPQTEEDHADAFTSFVKPYSPNDDSIHIQNKQKIIFEIPDKNNKKTSKDSSEECSKDTSDTDTTEDISGKDKMVSEEMVHIDDNGNSKNHRNSKEIDTTESSEENSGKDKERIGEENVKENKNICYSADSDSKILEIKDEIAINDNDLINQIVDRTANIYLNNELENKGILQNNETGEIELKNENEAIIGIIDNDSQNADRNSNIPYISAKISEITVSDTKPENNDAKIGDDNQFTDKNEDRIGRETQATDKNSNIPNNPIETKEKIEARIGIIGHITQDSDDNMTMNKNISDIPIETREILTSKADTQNITNDTISSDDKSIAKITLDGDTQKFKSDALSDIDIQRIKDDILSKVYCNKCFNVKMSGVCICINVNLYYQLLAKANVVSRCETKKIVEPDIVATVDLSSAIALINRYCGKLPSDTFTRLAPQWWMEEVQLPVSGSNEMRPAYICTLRLPLNCPVKYNIVGHPMPTRVLARRMVALQACRILHKSGELDNQLMPIGKENFKAVELEASNTVCAFSSGDPIETHDSARPGTTKRRQYYYKRTAWAFTDCQPVIDTSDSELYPGVAPELLHIDSDTEVTKKEHRHKDKHITRKEPGKKRNMLYAIVSKLWCALPERYNTRGRRLHAPQLASQAIGILMSRQEPHNLQIPAFPVYTRSGEVRVSVEHVPDADVRMSPRRAKLVRRFMRFVFAEVLRVRRRGMKLQSEGSTHNNYYIVPTVKTQLDDGTHKIDIDWAFLELIYQHTEEKKLSDIEKPIFWQENSEDSDQREREGNRKRRGRKRMANPLLKQGETFVFDAEKYKEAVVTPWYRNQDQPQFFLVAEICWNLTPDSSFPSATHQSFRDYYSTKYGVSLTQREQPLLDVDHTSARLNLLTPRYVNRKGVALPVSSERTRRAKRDRLDQKQILIPELCRVHPFAAPLWFATVALPCVLYRINALLIADEIRRAVAIDVGLGIPKINDKTMPGFQWPALDFGWSLAEVLSADSEKNEKKKEEEELKKEQKEKERQKEEKSRHPTEEPAKEAAEEIKEKTINDILQEKEDAEAEAAFEIGTWSNDMASSIPETSEYDELMEPLPPNLTFCTSASGGTNWCDPIGRPRVNQFNPTRNFAMADSDDSFMSSDLDSDDTDLDYDGSDEDTDTTGFSSKNTHTTMGVRIEYKTPHEAEAIDIERIKKVNPAPLPDEEDDALDRAEHDRLIRQGSAPPEYIEKFRASVSQHKQDILDKGHLITKDNPLIDVLPETKESYHSAVISHKSEDQAIQELFPFTTEKLIIKNGQIDIESIEQNKRLLLEKIKDNLPEDEIKKFNCFSMKDINIDAKDYVNEKIVNVGFDSKEGYEKICSGTNEFRPYYAEGKSGKEFDFDFQPVLEGHPGPSPSVILQALTMSNANDGINLERLETIGDSFLKFAITAYLYCAHPTVHEGKLSHMRSKQVSNLNLYRLGRNKRLGARMIASKFEPHDNWLPPCHKPPPTLHPRINGEGKDIMQHLDTPLDAAGCFIPYNLITQHSIPDKSIADCVEALIGAYLLECGPRGALLFMSWLGIRVLPCHHVPLPKDHPYVTRAESETADMESSSSSSPERKRSSSSSSSCSDDDTPINQEVFPSEDWSWPGRAVGSLQPYKDAEGRWMQPIFGELKAPPSPLLQYIEDPEGELEQMLSGYDALERTLQYRFKDRSLLLQALTHASHHSNRLTDCYQRLEFLGDAILDYLITRHLYEDPRRHSPGALTDLRSALVNNTIFATLAARHGFHKYFRHMSPGLNEVLTKYVKIQEENGHSISEEHYLIQEDEMEQAEDVEVPKALGDLFESVAGAIFLDSGMSLGAVWKSYVNLMGAELEAFSAAAPKSPVRELLEAEPDTAKFGKPERLADGRRVRVCVEVFGRGTFKGVGRNYRIAKGTAARCALRHLKVHRAR